ncbi:DUF2505 domain-containing protein [Nocardioides sp. TF02-7]|uniref:DUF2505 domain-containing protein n=1 Tax=Nocardioides sp. TF02-7 TaxID=2917724 RepID=UPI001F052734|nr:DUF2505 domain-containing protein [Nocardioides sp. TF02-7]UMG91777.1 DUF2505 domain-containing protein [Nocardioides sp. TF02-7]
MATRLVHELTYDAPVEAVARMLTDREFREEVCRAVQATSYAVTVDRDASATKVRIEMEQPTDGVPSFARKLVGATTTVVQAESWTSPTHADVHVSIPGKPGEMEGTTVLEQRDGRTVEVVDLRISVRIPLVAGKVEDLLAKFLVRALKAENRVGQDWLAR